jgi:hypothetical protein
MTIKKKDGSIYKLRGPNPLMKEQDLWDKNEFILHNMKGFRQTLADNTEVNPIASDFNHGQTTVIITPKKEEEPAEEQMPTNVFHCLPAIIRRHTDTLYNESYSTVKYDAPFTFEALVVDQSDLALQFWTSAVAADKITEGSVVYPKNTEKRWWRVQDRAVSWAGGYLMTAMPSDFQPAFI